MPTPNADDRRFLRRSMRSVGSPNRAELERYDEARAREPILISLFTSKM
jgi:hypothetical protein